MTLWVLYKKNVFVCVETYDLELFFETGADLALQQVNLDPDILPNHILDILVEDTECYFDEALSKDIFSTLKSSRPVVGILGINQLSLLCKQIKLYIFRIHLKIHIYNF